MRWSLPFFFGGTSASVKVNPPTFGPNHIILLVIVGYCWLLLVVVGYCWLLLVIVGYCWLYHIHKHNFFSSARSEGEPEVSSSIPLAGSPSDGCVGNSETGKTPWERKLHHSQKHMFWNTVNIILFVQIPLWTQLSWGSWKYTLWNIFGCI